MSVVLRPQSSLDGRQATDQPSRRAITRYVPWRTQLGVEGSAGLAIVLVLAAAFAIVPEVSRHGPSEIVAAPLQAPSWDHPFGTDTLGRDIFTRAFAAGLTDLSITILAVSLSLGIGTCIGVVLGTVPSARVRAVALRLVDAVLAFPFLILVLALVVVIGNAQLVPGLPAGAATIVIAIAAVAWAPHARLATATTLTLRNRESVVAARLLGYHQLRILARHILPSVVGVCVSFAATQAILTTALTASLAFLGAGVQEPTPELGAMMELGIALLTTAWWVTMIPGAIVLLLGVGFALVADALSDQA
jgi:peptide/nickel transport system permease protein